MSNILIHIGLYKAGSSFLADWYEQNPYLHSKQKSFAGFHNVKDILEFADKTDIANIKYFVLRDIQFSFTNPSIINYNLNYFEFRNELYSMFSRIFHNPKILLVLRGKESFLRSAYSQYIREGGYLNFNELIDQNSDFLKQFFDYKFHIEECINIFGKENILVIPFELLSENPTEFTSNIEDFLEIPHFEYIPRIKNKSLNNSELYWQLKTSQFIYSFFKLFGGSGLWCYKSYKNFLKRKSKKEKLPLLVTFLNRIYPNKELVINTIELPDIKIIFDNMENFNTFTKYRSSYM